MTFVELPLGGRFVNAGKVWIKTDIDRAKPDNGPGPSYFIDPRTKVLVA